MAQEMGARTLLPNCDWMLASIALQRGEMDEAAARVAAYRADFHLMPGGVHTGTYIVTAAEVADVRNESAIASKLLAPVYNDLAGHRLLLVIAPTAASTLTRRALGRGNRTDAANVVAEGELLATANPTLASLGAAAQHARGLLDRDPSALAGAEAAHRQPWARASAAEDLGAMLGQVDDPEHRATLERAAAAYERAGATRDADRARIRLRAIRPTRWHPVGPDPAATGWPTLTETELRVARLVSRGLTNSQVGAQMFVSRHTVGVHLRNIYRKLGVNSRVELTRLVVEEQQ